jgi:hypothetical protein
MKIALPILTDDNLADAIARTERELGRKVQLGRNTDHGGVSVRSMDVRAKHGVLGKLGEIAFGLAHQLKTTDDSPDPTLTDFQHPQFKLEIRTTDWDNGHLLVYRKDDGDKFVMLVTGDFPQFFYRGAIRVRDVWPMNDWWESNADPPCWFVPQTALKSVREILTGKSDELPKRDYPQAPDLQEWIAKYGGYRNIPWVEWDKAMEEINYLRRYWR